MKGFPSLKKVEIGAITAAAILIAGCGQAPTDDAPANAGQIEALRKQAASLKSKLASTQSHIDNLRLELNNGDAQDVSGGLSASDILDELMEIKLTSGNRGRIQRRINFLFESLSEQGEAAGPHIREFLNRMEDVDFAAPKSPKDESKELEYWRTRMVHGPLDFDQPPSLRIGLIDILAEVGGKKAEETLVEVLSTTGRGLKSPTLQRSCRNGLARMPTVTKHSVPRTNFWGNRSMWLTATNLMLPQDSTCSWCWKCMATKPSSKQLRGNSSMKREK